jgi:hypothetical protein
MKCKIPLKDCLAVWQEEQAQPFEDDGEELLALLEGRLEGAHLDDLFDRLNRSPEGRRRLFEMERFVGQRGRIEVALSKAAADAAHPESFTITTEGRRYQLIYRRLLEKQNQGVLTLKVAPHLQPELENQVVTVIDAAGQKIMQGKVEGGELSRRIQNPISIQWQTLLIKEEEA